MFKLKGIDELSLYGIRRPGECLIYSVGLSQKEKGNK